MSGNVVFPCYFDQQTLAADPCAGVLCGAAASGGFHWNLTDVAKSATCMGMSGPFLTGYTQTINDYFDRDIDAINEPNRPIPSGHAPSSAMQQCCCNGHCALEASEYHPFA